MRRIWGVVCLVIAVVLIVGAALIKWVAAPALVKVPLSISSVTVSEGTAQAFILSKQAVSTVPVVATRTVTGDKAAGTSSVAVYDEVLCIRVKSTTPSDKYGCVPSSDPGFLERTTDRVAFDRKTALPPADQEKFKAALDGDTKIPHTGIGYTFPIDTKAKTYPFFDTEIGKSFPMQFQAKEKVNGLDTYRFQQQVPTSDFKLAGILPGTYANIVTVWVEPTTGVIVKGSEDTTEKFAGTGAIAYQGKVTFNDATVKEQVKFAKDQLSKVHLIRTWLPSGVLILGVILLIIGAVLIRGSSSRDGQPVNSQT
jgi:hypothetical protein